MALLPVGIAVVAFALLFGGKKKKKKGTPKRAGLPTKKRKPKRMPPPDEPDEPDPVYDDEHCGLYPWLPDEVDEAAWVFVDMGITDMEDISIAVAKKIYAKTPEDGEQKWPPRAGDLRATCILDRIRIRVNLILAEKADDDAGDGDVEDDWGEYPEPGPIDLDTITHPDNYPEPGLFHQVGGPNSGTTTKHIAQKALMQAHYKMFQDNEAAEAFADDPENWVRYREMMDCSPFNDAYLGSRHTPGGGFWYDTPTGRQIAMMPVHDDLLEKMAYGDVMQRRVHIDNPQQPPGGQQPAIWLPPLSEAALAEGRVELDDEYWYTGDSKILPPPEVLVLVDPVESDIPANQLWGCLGYELAMGEEAA